VKSFLSACVRETGHAAEVCARARGGPSLGVNTERPPSPARLRARIARVRAELAAAHLRRERLELDMACAGPRDEAEIEARLADAEATIAELEARREDLESGAPGESPAVAVPVGPPANDTAPAAPEYASTREAAVLLGISRRTLEGLRARGEGPSCIRIGKRVLYPLAALRGVAK
jgi:hypothetical protein